LQTPLVLLAFSSQALLDPYKTLQPIFETAITEILAASGNKFLLSRPSQHFVYSWTRNVETFSEMSNFVLASLVHLPNKLAVMGGKSDTFVHVHFLHILPLIFRSLSAGPAIARHQLSRHYPG